MVGPWLNSLWERKKSLSDIEYLSIKDFGGKLVKNVANRATTGDLGTLTASGGKDMYLAKAHVSGWQSGNGFKKDATIVLKINGVIVETAYFSASGTTTGAGAGGTHSQNYEFTVGYKVVATQIIKLEVTVLDGYQLSGTVECFEENTGVSPAI